MQKVLTPSEIDAMVRVATRKEESTQKKETRSIKPCTFKQSGQLTSDRLSSVKMLHAAFARDLSQTLGAYLRVSCEVELAAIEQLVYSEFLKRMPEFTYMLCFRVNSAAAAMQLDHSVVFPLVDILLGGTGLCEALNREVSEIEEEIMDGVGRIVCQELETAWVAMNAKLELEGRQQSAQMQRLLPPTESTLCMSFNVKLAEATGVLHVVLPVSISNTLLRSLSTEVSYEKPRAADRTRERITATVLGCSFATELGISDIKLSIPTLMQLAPQSVCNLGIPVKKPASLLIAGREIFDATPARHGRLRAAQLGQKITLSAEKGKR
ncbi:MAG: hypothetical protein WAK29_24025 [Terriglobales bacterium]